MDRFSVTILRFSSITILLTWLVYDIYEFAVNCVFVCLFVYRSLVGAGVSQFKSDTLRVKLPFFERFRNSEDR